MIEQSIVYILLIINLFQSESDSYPMDMMVAEEMNMDELNAEVDMVENFSPNDND